MRADEWWDLAHAFNRAINQIVSVPCERCGKDSIFRKCHLFEREGQLSFRCGQCFGETYGAAMSDFLEETGLQEEAESDLAADALDPEIAATEREKAVDLLKTFINERLEREQTNEDTH